MGLTEAYEAFCFDQAISYAGSWIQGELDNVKTGKGKNADKHRKAQQMILLDRLLYGKTSPTKFRDPASMLGGGE